MPECKMRAQLLAVSRFVDLETARRVSALWYALSRVAHHDDYALAPTATELRDWHREATHLCAALMPSTETP
ncbi:hypothetical protein [Saccharopolyspora phatthalungensis]|uniref:Uncharacterized protein n=1 Tax=Saccharopolyspora phatthalungensis TaxID=664693 RepID=A0A840Q002_9PSEU|nr:hypothetical protein [Saccharopolyspora phatthalungensis]MBB5153634.1 hypothetical protein [Saccharopolyspora phatthalungensis]